MANIRTKNEIEQVIRIAVQYQKFVQFVLPSYASFLTGKSIPYLSNGLSSVATMVSGGTLYTNSSFTYPLPPVAPSGSVPAVITFTNTLGVLSAPVVTNSGSGYSCAVTSPWSPPDPTGDGGASVLLSPANADQPYNYTPYQVGLLQFYIGLDYAQLGLMLNGSVGCNTVTGIAIHSGAAGTGYLVGDTAIVTQSGLYGCRLNVASVVGGGPGPGVPASLTINIGGIGAAVASNLATTGGTGSGLHVDISTVAAYNWYNNSLAWAGWSD